MAWLLPLLALVFALTILWLGKVSRDALYANNLEIVERSSRATVRAVEASMLDDHGGTAWSALAERIAAEQGGWIRILATDGRVVFSSDPGSRRTT